MAEKSRGYAYQITIIGILFFIFGFVTWLNGTLIPFLKTACELNNFESYFVTFAFYISYFFMAIPSSWILQKTGFKNGMSLGLVVMAIGAVIFIPAANSRSFLLFLIGLFVQGLGLAILQTASNPYVTILGPMESAAKRISIMGICNKVAGILSPLILATVVLAGIDELEAHLLTVADAAERAALLDQLASRVIGPYIIMTIVLLGLALMMRVSNLPEVESEEAEVPGQDAAVVKTGKTSVFQFPHLLLGAFTLFLYVGVEVMAGDTIIAYG
ncbi:MAG TPA: MFS transporter, partial [Anseongella sp.]|nr:MFS transporter [Anseongella sp.]